jgi:hypothetical protein
VAQDADAGASAPHLGEDRPGLGVSGRLELSSNQITHFYSKKKNTKEMIKLLRRLLIRYKTAKRIFLSWDSASWHASKVLFKVVDEMNSEKFRNRTTRLWSNLFLYLLVRNF